MNLSTEQRQRVEAIVYADTRAEAIAQVARLASPEELHAVMLAHNWDSGLEVLVAILEHPLCERGTASMMYFFAQGPWTDIASASPRHAELIRRTSEKLLSGEMPERIISYCPDLGKVDLYKLRKAGVPEGLLRPSGPKPGSS